MTAISSFSFIARENQSHPFAKLSTRRRRRGSQAVQCAEHSNTIKHTRVLQEWGVKKPRSVYFIHLHWTKL